MKTKVFALAIAMLLALITPAVMAQQEGVSSKRGMMQEKSGATFGESMKGMHGMMREMMKGQQSGDGSMQDMGGMMGMMKMMEQCATMMESARGSEGAKENKK